MELKLYRYEHEPEDPAVVFKAMIEDVLSRENVEAEEIEGYGTEWKQEVEFLQTHRLYVRIVLTKTVRPDALEEKITHRVFTAHTRDNEIIGTSYVYLLKEGEVTRYEVRLDGQDRAETVGLGEVVRLSQLVDNAIVVPPAKE